MKSVKKGVLLYQKNRYRQADFLATGSSPVSVGFQVGDFASWLAYFSFFPFNFSVLQFSLILPASVYLSAYLTNYLIII